MANFSIFDLQISGSEKYYYEHNSEIRNLYGSNFGFGYSTKWPEHETVMRDYSTKYPEVLFKLYIDDLEEEQLYCEYYLNGKMQRVSGEIVYGEFDENKLV